MYRQWQEVSCSCADRTITEDCDDFGDCDHKPDCMSFDTCITGLPMEFNECYPDCCSDCGEPGVDCCWCITDKKWDYRE